MSRLFPFSRPSPQEKYFFADDDDDPFLETQPLMPQDPEASPPKRNASFPKWQPLHLSRALHEFGGLHSRLGPSLERCLLLRDVVNICAEVKVKRTGGAKDAPGIGFVLYVACASPLAATFLLSWLVRVGIAKGLNYHEESVLWFISYSLFALTCVALHQRLRHTWARVLRDAGSLQSRSILISSSALRGIESLVPNAKEVAEFFRGSFNIEPENVLVILEVGDRLKELRLEGKETTASCCRVLPECTKVIRMAKKQYRADTSLHEEDSKLGEEAIKREVESSGCVIVTFESVEVVEKFLALSRIPSVSLRRCWRVSEDHALHWWSMPPVQFPVALGESENKVFMRIAPDPSDINYEAFVPLRPKRSNSLLSVTTLFLYALVNVAVSAGVIFLSRQVKVEFFRAALVGCFAACQILFLVCCATTSRYLSLSNYHSTFTSLQKSWFVSGVVLSVAALSPVVYISTRTTLEWERYTGVICVLLFEAVVLASRLRSGLPTCKQPVSMIAFGRVYTEFAVVLVASFAVAQQKPIVLLFAALLLRCEAVIVCRDVSALETKRKFGPDLAFSLVRLVPPAATIPLLLSTLYKPKPVAVWLSTIAVIGALFWCWASYLHCFTTPPIKSSGDSPSAAFEPPGDDEVSKSGTSISFRSNSSEQWEDQLVGREQDPTTCYVMPPL